MHPSHAQPDPGRLLLADAIPPGARPRFFLARRVLSAFGFALLIITGAFLIVLIGMAMREG